MPELLDFDVAIEPLGDGYRARVITSPAGEAHADFVLPFSDQGLEILVLKVVGSIGRVRRKVRRIQSEERRLLEDFGGQLFQAVFSGAVGDCLGRSRLVADTREAGLRIRLRLPGALANIPWEYLYDGEYGGFLGLSPEAALVRYVELPVSVRPFPISPPLRILTMISAPADMAELEAEAEWEKLTGALADLTGAGLVQVDRLAAGTLAALQRPLRLSDYHVLHFIGHGGYDADADDGALALEGAGGKTRLVTGRDLGLMIRGHRSLRLVVLNACEGARSARNDPFGGVAQALVHQGIPAVIAMQFEISDPAALVFSQAFYQAIADGLPVDVAMVEARRAMFAEGNEVEWATPVLYLRSPDGRIFTKGRATETGRQAREQAVRQAREEAERQAREEAERQAQEEEARQAKEEAERQAQEEAERRAKAAAERQAQAEAERQAREHLESLGYMTLAAMGKRMGLVVPGTRQELIKLLLAQPAELRAAAEGKAREAADRQAREEADRRAREEADRQAQEEAERRARDRQAREEAEQAKAAAERQAREAAEQAKAAAERQAREHLETLGYTTLAAIAKRLNLVVPGTRWELIELLLAQPARPLAAAEQAIHEHAEQQAAQEAERQAREEAGRRARERAERQASAKSGPEAHGSRPHKEDRPKPSRTRPAPYVPQPRTLQTGYPVWALALSPDGARLATGGNGKIRMWNLQTGAAIWEVQPRGFLHGSLAAAFSPDGTRLATGSANKGAQIWDASTGRQQLEVTHGKEVRAVAFSPDGNRLATGSADKTARIWDAATGLEQLKLSQDACARAVAFSPDGTRLATGNLFTIARIWDASTGRQQLEVSHGFRIWAMAISPDGTRLATGSDKTARVWDASTGLQHLEVKHDGHVRAVAFSPDGTRLVTGSQDKTARIWDITGR